MQDQSGPIYAKDETEGKPFEGCGKAIIRVTMPGNATWHGDTVALEYLSLHEDDDNVWFPETGAGNAPITWDAPSSRGVFLTVGREYRLNCPTAGAQGWLDHVIEQQEIIA